MRIAKLMQKTEDDTILKPKKRRGRVSALIPTEEAPEGYAGAEMSAKDVLRVARRKRAR